MHIQSERGTSDKLPSHGVCIAFIFTLLVPEQNRAKTKWGSRLANTCCRTRTANEMQRSTGITCCTCSKERNATVLPPGGYSNSEHRKRLVVSWKQTNRCMIECRDKGIKTMTTTTKMMMKIINNSYNHVVMYK